MVKNAGGANIEKNTNSVRAESTENVQVITQVEQDVDVDIINLNIINIQPIKMPVPVPTLMCQTSEFSIDNLFPVKEEQIVPQIKKMQRTRTR